MYQTTSLRPLTVSFRCWSQPTKMLSQNRLRSRVAFSGWPSTPKTSLFNFVFLLNFQLQGKKQKTNRKAPAPSKGYSLVVFKYLKASKRHPWRVAGLRWLFFFFSWAKPFFFLLFPWISGSPALRKTPPRSLLCKARSEEQLGIPRGATWFVQSGRSWGNLVNLFVFVVFFCGGVRFLVFSCFSMMFCYVFFGRAMALIDFEGFLREI